MDLVQYEVRCTEFKENPEKSGIAAAKVFNYYDKTGASMAAAEQRSEFKFVFLQRINLKSNYKRRFKSLAGTDRTKR